MNQAFWLRPFDSAYFSVCGQCVQVCVGVCNLAWVCLVCLITLLYSWRRNLSWSLGFATFQLDWLASKTLESPISVVPLWSHRQAWIFYGCWESNPVSAVSAFIHRDITPALLSLCLVHVNWIRGGFHHEIFTMNIYKYNVLWPFSITPDTPHPMTLSHLPSAPPWVLFITKMTLGHVSILDEALEMFSNFLSFWLLEPETLYIAQANVSTAGHKDACTMTELVHSTLNQHFSLTSRLPYIWDQWKFLFHSKVHKAGPGGARLSAPSPCYNSLYSLPLMTWKLVLISDCVNSGTWGKGHHTQ